LVDAGGERIDLGGQAVDLVEQHAGQLSVMVVELAGQRLDEPVVLGPHPPACQPGEHPRVALSAMSASSMSRTEIVSILLAIAETLSDIS
jgi:hypothetical protein